MEGTPSYWQKPLVSNHWTQNKFCWDSAITVAGSQTRFQSILWNQVIFKNNYSTNWHAKINILYLTAFIFIRVYEQGIYMGVENSLLYSLPSCTRVLIRISWFDSNSILTGRTEVEGGGGGGLMDPSQSFWYVALFRNEFAFGGTFYWWWHCWGPVTSPTQQWIHPLQYRETLAAVILHVLKSINNWLI